MCMEEITMPTFYQQQMQLVEALREKLNGLLENDSDIEVNSVDELKEKFEDYCHTLTNPYSTLPEIKENVVTQSTSADGWKYAKRKHTKRK